MSETRLHSNLWQYTGKTYQPYSDFWKTQLAQLETIFLLEGTTQTGVSSRGEKQISKLTLNETTTQTIEAIAKKDDLGIYIVVLSGIAYLLSRYSGKPTVVIDSPLLKAHLLSNDAILERIPIITKIEEQDTLKTYIAKCSEIISKTYSYQNFPLQELIVTNETKDYLTTNVIAWLPQIHGSCSNLNHYDLGIEICTKANLSLILHYNPICFDRFFINGFAQHLQHLFSAYASRDTHLAEIEILSNKEKTQLLVDWAMGESVEHKPQTIHEVFEAQVSQTPNQIALQTPTGAIMTYRELDSLANRLAYYLNTQYSIQPDDLIGVMLERSERLIIALLAILKAGGAYVPIAPDTPSERLEFFIRDAKPKVLLMELESLPHLQNFLDTPMFAMDVQLEALDDVKHSLPKNQPSDLAYVLYTSGSTGTPKGVMVEHQSFVNMAKAQIDAFGILPSDRVLQFANTTFDASLSEIFMALFCGATLLLIDKAVINDRKQFLTCLNEQKVTVATFPPSYLQALDQPDFKYLRVMITAGETAHQEDARYYAPQLDYFNAYGLTETSVCATYHKVCVESTAFATISIGKPIPNTAVYVLDKRLRPVPTGVIGEICIAGIGLARGYLHKPDLTASKFVDNPFKPGEVLYRTGDLGKRLPSGKLVFLGRQDNQVKVRGYRIELGEIEAALNRHPDVKQAVVLARTGHDGNQELVAYVVAEPRLGSSELREAVSHRLPEYMIPTVFVLLEELPTNANGKIDCQMVSTLETSDAGSQKSLDLPRTPTEEMIAALWAEVLGLEQVGIHENFFEIGGHSLLATQLISRIREALSVEIPQRSLFEAPTVAQLSLIVEATCQTGTSLPSTTTIKPIPRNEPLPLSFAQQRLWFLDQLEESRAAYNISSAILLTGKLHVTALEQAIAEIVRRHETLRTIFSAVDGFPVQTIVPKVTVAIPRLDLQSLAPEEQSQEVQRLATKEALRPFDLVNGPLLRIHLLILAQEEYVMLVTMHHIVSDGWSIGIFLRELSTLYEAFYTKYPSPLPELPIQYADFAVWQRQWLSEEVLETQLNYWKKQLAEAPRLLELPTDYPRPAAQSFRGSSVSFQLNPELTQQLLTLSQQSGTTFFMTVLAAFKTLLYRYTMQDDIVVGTDIANRQRLEIEGIIGFFVNQLVLRTHFSGNPSFQELLERVRTMVLSAYAHQDLPFDLLVKALKPQRNPSYTPLFQVKLVFLNAPMPALELSNLLLTPLEIERRVTQHDLILFLWESEQSLIGSWEYNTDLFNSTTIFLMSERFKTLLESICAQPNTRLQTLEMFTETERNQQAIAQQERDRHNLQKLKNIKPKPINNI